MRVLPATFVLALVALAATPGASAATFELGASRVLEGALVPGAEAAFEMPIVAEQEGLLYAKVLPTPGNAVHDGTTANGSVADGSGWRVTFAMRMPSGERVELGTFANSSLSERVPVAVGDALTLLIAVHVPPDAALGGAEQRVYVAVAYRPPPSVSSATSSGGTMDEARALTLVLRATGDLPVAQPDPPAEATPGPEAKPDESGVPPVAPLIVAPPAQLQLPKWFLVGALLLVAALVAVLALVAAALFALARAHRGAAPAHPSDARGVRVKDASTHVELRSSPKE